MKEKIKAVLHRRNKSTPPQSPRASYEQHEDRSPRGVEQHATSPARPARPLSSETPDHDPRRAHRDQPFSPARDERANNSMTRQPAPADSVQSPNTDINGSIAADYRSYLPVLAPGDDAHAEQQATLDRDRRLPTGESETRRGEDVTDKNINRHRTSLDTGRSKPLPAIPDYDTIGSTAPSGPATGKYGVSRDLPLHSGPKDSSRSQRGSSSHEKNGWKKSGQPDQGVASGKGRPQGSDGDDRFARALPGEHIASRDMADESSPGLAITTDQNGMDGGEDWKEKQRSLLAGVVDLKNTVDVDRDTQWAPPVTHEIVKPHEHEVIQHKVFREIHNYTYYHRLQPVLQTEVLPPRHFIPNPKGEGLMEISADELPARTGKNRWWDIVQKETELPEAPFQWRTEPEVIEGKPYITDEGFERRETTIIYPPKLQDMSGYGGMVQPVHFDHKTGERWLGEITTMDKLKHELDQATDSDIMTMKDVTADLPQLSSSPTVRRKPLGRDSL
ncbi:hypothetical protein BDW02DRAFT_30795 [Decorospora gaudefroyi]|uniref:Uncharacterized protein n=1 Tax=Decorospora gaudefroyi TaxID=184978 RepID=A0A6A5K5I2_9PLEO|nr:hypothetical protein BDW02DRAFT_30795 [Decorospora gaudefroyi]